jgi:hypothetical protein
VADLSRNQIAIKRDDLITTKMSKDIAYYKELGLSLPEVLTAIEKLYSV